jgi:hypothetical protein
MAPSSAVHRQQTKVADQAEPDPILLERLIAEIDERLHTLDDLVQLLEQAPEMLSEPLDTHSRNAEIRKSQAAHQKLLVARRLLCAELERQNIPR